MMKKQQQELKIKKAKNAMKVSSRLTQGIEYDSCVVVRPPEPQNPIKQVKTDKLPSLNGIKTDGKVQEGHLRVNPT